METEIVKTEILAIKCYISVVANKIIKFVRVCVCPQVCVSKLPIGISIELLTV